MNGDGDSNSAPTHGAYNVAAGYAEFKAPIFKDMPWVKELSVDGSVRYDYYSIFGSATTWKANLEYAPTEDVRFRGTRATGFRAPSIKELFGGAFQNFEPIDADPCDTAIGRPAGTRLLRQRRSRRRWCHGSRRPISFDSHPGVATVNSGTPTLQPFNESRAGIFGLVFTPRWVHLACRIVGRLLGCLYPQHDRRRHRRCASCSMTATIRRSTRPLLAPPSAIARRARVKSFRSTLRTPTSASSGPRVWISPRTTTVQRWGDRHRPSGLVHGHRQCSVSDPRHQPAGPRHLAGGLRRYVADRRRVGVRSSRAGRRW